MDAELLLAGVIGSARGLKGEVFVEVRTDRADQVFAPGMQLILDGTSEAAQGASFRSAVPASTRTMRVASSHTHNGRLIVRFRELTTREEAEEVRGSRLMVAEASEEDAWYSHEVAGFLAFSPQGDQIGVVSGIMPGAAHDYLLVDVHGKEVMVPLVSQIVPEVSASARRVVVDAPAGLFDLN